MNKADYIALINTKLPDGGNIPSSDHRDTMHTDANSIIEVVYGAALTDTDLLETYTTKESNFGYRITMSKVGSNVTLTARVSCTTTTSFPLLFSISDTNLIAENIRYNAFATIPSSPDMIPITIQNGTVKALATINAMEILYFTINYKALN